MTAPLALVEGESIFDKNPRLETVVGFFVHPRRPATTAVNIMSKTIEQTKKAPSGKSVELGPTMSGSEILVACLEREGVDTIFAYPGGASMEIHQALTRSKIRTVLPRHEGNPCRSLHLRVFA